MCPARVEVLADYVLVKEKNVILGKGRGVYELRDFDPEMEVFGATPAEPPGSISCLTLELGEHIGRATIRTRKHDTAIDVEVAHLSAGVGRPTAGTSGSIIFDETYGRGRPSSVPIVDSNRTILAIVTHQSADY